MDNKITKERISRHLEYDWFKYLLILVAAIAIWVAIYSVVNNPRGYERMDICVIAPSVYANTRQDFYTSYNQSLAEAEDSTIVETNMEHLNANQTSVDIATVLTARLISSDILIVPDEWLERVKGDFLELTVDIKTEFFSNFEMDYATENERDYAILLNEESLPGFTKLISPSYNKLNEEGEEVECGKTYYLGILQSSENIGKYSTKNSVKKTNNLQAFLAVQSLARLFA